MPTAKLAEAGAFWDALAPVLGWHALPGPGGERHFSDGQLRVVLVSGQDAGARGLHLGFEAPSRRAVEALHQALTSGAVPGAASVGAPASREDGFGFGFVDPSGLTLAYVFAGG